jgi:hypothetical protein
VPEIETQIENEYEESQCQSMGMTMTNQNRRVPDKACRDIRAESMVAAVMCVQQEIMTSEGALCRSGANGRRKQIRDVGKN